MAQTVKGRAGAKDKNVTIAPGHDTIEKGPPELSGIIGAARELDEVMATAAALTGVQAVPDRKRSVSKLAANISRVLLAALRARGKQSDRNSMYKPRSAAVGVLPADWEYLTNIAANVRGDAWRHLFMGDGQNSNRRRI